MQAAAPLSYCRMPRLVFLIRRLRRANYEREMKLLDLLCDRERPSMDVGAKIGMYTYRIRRLDDYSLSDAGFITIDVEGHELAVLEGAAVTRARHTPNLLIECNYEHQPDAIQRLGAHEYTTLFLDGSKLRPIEQYQREVHWIKLEIENFIAIHRSRSDVLDRLRERVATT